eukprot:SAG11_NODE_26_length_23420_cov_40.459886_7_plen_117_part_00
MHVVCGEGVVGADHEHHNVAEARGWPVGLPLWERNEPLLKGTALCGRPPRRRLREETAPHQSLALEERAMEAPQLEIRRERQPAVLRAAVLAVRAHLPRTNRRTKTSQKSAEDVSR